MKHLLSGSVFGGHTGYNWQNENLVYGVEGDFDGGGISGRKTRRFPSKLNPRGAINGAMSSDSIDWLSSIRGRVGLAQEADSFF